MILVVAINLAMEEIYRAKYCEMRMQEVSFYGAYPKYLFFGDVELKGITYFDARKLMSLPSNLVSYGIKKIVKTCDTCYGKSYYHIETHKDGSYVLIISSSKLACKTLVKE